MPPSAVGGGPGLAHLWVGRAARPPYLIWTTHGSEPNTALSPFFRAEFRDATTNGRRRDGGSFSHRGLAVPNSGDRNRILTCVAPMMDGKISENPGSDRFIDDNLAEHQRRLQ